MKFGHYSNEELGIRRDMTCSMFRDKGVDTECGQNYSEQKRAAATKKYAGLKKKMEQAAEKLQTLLQKIKEAQPEQYEALKKEYETTKSKALNQLYTLVKQETENASSVVECQALRDATKGNRLIGGLQANIDTELRKMKRQRDKSKKMSNDIDELQCSVGAWDSPEAAEHGLSILSGYIEKQMRKGANVQQLTQNVRSRISEGLNEMAKAGCTDKDRKAAAMACDRILETLRARGAKCAMRSMDDVFNESDKVCEDHIRAILQDVKQARRTVKGWAGTSEGAKVNYKMQAKYREGAKDLLNRIIKRGQISAAKRSELEMMIQQICGITAHTEWEFQRIVKEQQK